MRSVLITAFAFAIATAIAIARSARAITPCGSFVSGGAPVHAKVIRGATPCRTARRVLGRYLSSRPRARARRACATGPAAECGRDLNASNV